MDNVRQAKTRRLMNELGSNPTPEAGEEQMAPEEEQPLPEQPEEQTAGQPKTFSKDALSWLKSTFGGIKKPAKGIAGKQVESIDSTEEEQSDEQF